MCFHNPIIVKRSRREYIYIACSLYKFVNATFIHCKKIIWCNLFVFYSKLNTQQSLMSRSLRMILYQSWLIGFTLLEHNTTSLGSLFWISLTCSSEKEHHIRIGLMARLHPPFFFLVAVHPD